ncbi:hypothetical protein PV04_02380 [Phialophora macrospora]|uniref:Class II aldolase/adducin N-terminal domain-containing protein n=1 Tax=Phialophora macrospora TaxID=1851006 RepID=A0A0D2E6Z9_9EURO|nr:hypothetical protein PV04_02380 [Phialophora macrospora]
MSANMAPALVRSAADFAEYNVGDGPQKGFVERYIHSEVYKRYAGVVCVIHAHADDVLPYTVSGVPFHAMAHMAGFVGSQPAPTFDVESHDERGDAHDLLIKNTRLGAAFASFFSGAGHHGELSERTVVLMRLHGFTTWGRRRSTAQCTGYGSRQFQSRREALGSLGVGSQVSGLVYKQRKCGLEF